jgi:hypothetical protein
MVIQLARTIPSTILEAIRRLDEALAQGSVEVAREAALDSRVQRRMWEGLACAETSIHSAVVTGEVSRDRSLERQLAAVAGNDRSL